jgi:hypothetical protein
MSLRLPRNTRAAERKTIARRVSNISLLKQEQCSHVSNGIIIIIIAAAVGLPIMLSDMFPLCVDFLYSHVFLGNLIVVVLLYLLFCSSVVIHL